MIIIKETMRYSFLKCYNVDSCWYQRLVCEGKARTLEGDNLTDRITHIGKTFYTEHRGQRTIAGNIRINFLVPGLKCPPSNVESYYLKYCPRDQFDIHDFFFEGEFLVQQ